MESKIRVIFGPTWTAEYTADGAGEDVLDSWLELIIEEDSVEKLNDQLEFEGYPPMHEWEPDKEVPGVYSFDQISDGPGSSQYITVYSVIVERLTIEPFNE